MPTQAVPSADIRTVFLVIIRLYKSGKTNYIGVHIGVYQLHPDIKRTLVAMSDRTGMSISQVADEVLYTGLIEMQELPELED
jgi:hypothetical protein|tara:strand:- start:1744 stop:1989 length:246 start_codon:yes stop_codon:yes gene_type:complete